LTRTHPRSSRPSGPSNVPPSSLQSHAGHPARDPQGRRRPRFSFFDSDCQRTRSTNSVRGQASQNPKESPPAPNDRAVSARLSWKPPGPSGHRGVAAPSVNGDIRTPNHPVNTPREEKFAGNATAAGESRQPPLAPGERPTGRGGTVPRNGR